MISVIIEDERSRKKYKVVGRFPFKDPWWKVNVKVKQAGSKCYAQGYPSYFLRTHLGENWKAVISLFFEACKVPEEFKTAFFEWLPEGSSLNFEHLEEKLNQFMVSELQERKNPKNTGHIDIFHYVKNSCK